MKTLSILLVVVLLLGLAVEVASAAGTPYTVVLGSGQVCYVYWNTGGARGYWNLRWNYSNGQSNLTYTCNARLYYGTPPRTTLHFAATNQPWCTIQNQAVVTTKGQVSWTCQGKYMP
jgi:hypothetical protein